VQQAETFLNSERSILLDPILPDPVQWSKALLSILEIIPNPELSLTNALGSAISLVQASVPEKLFQPPRDFNGFSGAFRMALYTSKLLSKWAQKGLPLNDAVMILRLLIMSYSAADDQSALAAENQLWIDTMDTEVQGQVSDFLYSERIILQAIFDDAKSWRDSEPGNPSTITAQILVKSLIEASEGTSPAAFYAARALNSVISKLVTTHGWKNLGGDEWLSSLGILKASTRNVFAAVAVISGLQEFLASSQFITNLCNHLVSDVTVASARGENTLKLFVLLNATLAIFEPSNLPVAQNRIVFAVKHITSWLSEDQRLPPLLAAEVCRSLQFLLPSIKDIYGPYWETSIKFCINQWKIKSAEKNFNERLALYSASLRLVTLLKGLSDPNDDLSEALLDSAKSISDGLLGLLKVPRTNDSSPWASFQNHLWRQTLDIPVNHIDDSALVYPLVASESFLIQSAAFSILNRVIPAAQEQVSIDVVLEKKGMPT
jgi:E3 ubiquitin-protein ligase listerin